MAIRHRFISPPRPGFPAFDADLYRGEGLGLGGSGSQGLLPGDRSLVAFRVEHPDAYNFASLAAVPSAATAAPGFR